MNSNASQENNLLKYFALVFALSVPLWLLGRIPVSLPANLPLSVLTTIVPATAAAILVWRGSGIAGIKEFLKKAWDYKKIKNRVWYLPTLLLPPFIYGLSYVIMRLTGLPLPEQINVPLVMVPVFLVLFMIGDTGEELGWSGFAIEPMQNRWGALKASFILGVLWAIWHSVAFLQTNHPISWVVWQCIKTVATRMMIVWIYNKTGKSVLASTFYHAADNVSWFLFPNYTSHYNPFVTGTLTWLMVIIVLFGWGSKRLASHRYAKISSR